MELAGLACAQALAVEFELKYFEKVMVICGPGNQVS
jgi:NAD(P)H-hydrate repair Nnr-like enzyme with NAD(P)H-hydrate epimerase domain